MHTENAPQKATTPRGAKANKPVDYFSRFLGFDGITPTKSDVILPLVFVVACFGIAHLASCLVRLWGLA